MPRLEIRYLSGHDVDRLAIGPDLILDATERALAAQGRGEVVLEPREHLVPDPAFDGHFNLLRAYVAPLDVAGVKVVGDYHGNYKLGLPSELALLTLYDPRTGVPRAIIDATAITEWRTGAVTALGGRHLARPGAKVLAHIGARGTAFANVTLLDRVHDYAEIRVTSARAESREAFAERLLQAFRERLARLGPRARDADLVVVVHAVEQRDVGERGAARADVAEDLRAGARQVAAAERGDGAGAPLGDRGRVDDRARDSRARVVERQQRQLRRQAELVVAVVVADDLDAGHAERRDVRAQEVEVAVERRVGHEVLARLEHDLAPPLRGERLLGRVEDQVGPARQGVDVVAGQVADLEAGHGSQGDSPGYQPVRSRGGGTGGANWRGLPSPGALSEAGL